MPPILVDNHDLLKLSIISVLVAALVFSGGYFMGYQQAVTASQVDSETQLLSLPEETDASEKAVKSQLPATIEAGEKMDVDQPEVATRIASKVSTKVAAKNTTKVSRTPKKKTSDPVKAPVFTQSLKKTPEKNKTVNSSSHSVIKEKTGLENTSESTLVGTVAASQSNEIKYSIQAGVYVRLVNAKNMMEMLKVQQYDAYVTDFINKNNETRYNVRIGYFTNKKSALEMLGKFKTDQKSDGYLVNFSAQNIVDTASTDVGVNPVEKTVNVPAIKNEVNDEIKKEPSPVIPIDTTQDKISQADI